MPKEINVGEDLIKALDRLAELIIEEEIERLQVHERSMQLLIESLEGLN